MKHTHFKCSQLNRRIISPKRHAGATLCRAQRLRQPKIGTALHHVFLLLGFKKFAARVSKVPNLFDKMLVFVYLKPIYFRKKLSVAPVCIVLNTFLWVFATFESIICDPKYLTAFRRCRAKLERIFFCTWYDFHYCASGCRRPTISIRSAVWSKFEYGWNCIGCSIGLQPVSRRASSADCRKLMFPSVLMPPQIMW